MIFGFDLNDDAITVANLSVIYGACIGIWAWVNIGDRNLATIRIDSSVIGNVDLVESCDIRRLIGNITNAFTILIVGYVVNLAGA